MALTGCLNQTACGVDAENDKIALKISKLLPLLDNLAVTWGSHDDMTISCVMEPMKHHQILTWYCNCRHQIKLFVTNGLMHACCAKNDYDCSFPKQKIWTLIFIAILLRKEEILVKVARCLISQAHWIKFRKRKSQQKWIGGCHEEIKSKDCLSGREVL